MDFDVIIVGGGPAGLTASLYTSRARLKTLLVENLSAPAQIVLTDCIENYPGFPDGISGFELMDKFKKQSEKFGTVFKQGEVKGIEAYKEKNENGYKVSIDKDKLTAYAVIIASGASWKKLGVKGEDELRGKGVSYCATCDAAFFKNKEVIVVGGGNAALEEALFLTKFVKKLTLVHRRDKLRATKVLQERAFSNKKIEFLFESQVVEIKGKDKVSSVRVGNINTKEEKDIPCDGIFIFVGYIPNTDFLKGLLELSENNYIIVDNDMNTSKDGIFACGDCTDKLLRQVVTACGDGATSAFSAQQYVEGLKGIAYK